MAKQREHWGSKLGFLLAAAGSAIGLGTLWKFPYVTGENGGGLFVLAYVLCTFFVSVPLFMAELALGRRAQRGAVGVFASLSHDSSVWKAAGWLGVIASFLIMTYYSVLAGWGLNYILMSLNQFWIGKSNEEISHVFEVLRSSGDITLFWQAAFIALTVGMVYPGVRHGIEYWSKLMTTSLFVLLIVLCGYAISLEGFGQAYDFLFSLKTDGLKPSSFLEALGLSFFTLSLGQGIMITYGSYLKRDEDIPKTGLIIGSTILLVACLAALTIFPVLFTFNHTPQAGPGLVFKALPLLFAKLPSPILLSTSFFILFVFTALTSAMPLIEVVVANFMDLFGWERKKTVLWVGLACFICGIPSGLSGTDWLFSNWTEIYGKTFFATIDDFVSIWIIPIAGLMTVIFTGWFLDTELLKNEFEEGSTLKWLWTPWVFFIRWLAPLAIVAILLQTTGLVNFDQLGVLFS